MTARQDRINANKKKVTKQLGELKTYLATLSTQKISADAYWGIRWSTFNDHLDYLGLPYKRVAYQDSDMPKGANPYTGNWVAPSHWVSFFGVGSTMGATFASEATLRSAMTALSNPDIQARVMRLDQLKKVCSDLQSKLDATNVNINYLINNKKALPADAFAAAKLGVIPVTVATQKFKLVYNASAPTEAYFSTQETWEYHSKGKTLNVMGSNVPKKLSDDAMDMWKNSTNHKGIIQPYVRRLDNKNTQGNISKPVAPNGYSSPAYDLSGKNERYAFQFLYNPGSVAMSYAGAPDIDVGAQIAGTEQFALLGSIGVTQSTIQFDLLINRMFDMKYYDPDTKMLRSDLKSHPEKVYPGKTPSEKEQKDIYNKGTMYDLEFLLRALLGYAAPTVLRGGEMTADIGYIGSVPVELHLGTSLRYLGIVNSIAVKHLTFNERMVPLFTSVSLNFNRIPDFVDIEGETTTKTGEGWNYRGGEKP